ncbi:MAG: hypothetical protein H6700_06855 [Myxococcales bacterium]|nr:hypothetical protein [Myxococcales bacterium]MCB9531467.1 hypothetical protein [Myxococcales bacterium]
MSHRRWYSGIVAITFSVRKTLGSLIAHRLGALAPVFGVLLLLAVVLWAVNTIAPLAPFVYSLF